MQYMVEIVLRGAALNARGRILREYEEKLFIMERNTNTQVSDGVGDAAPTTGSTNPQTVQNRTCTTSHNCQANSGFDGTYP